MTGIGVRTIFRRRGAARGAGWRALVPAVAAAAGLLIAASAATADGTDLRSSRSVQLSQLVAQRQQEVHSLQERDQVLRQAVADAAAVAGAGDARVDEAYARAEVLGDPAGLLPVTGAAVTVQLDDAPKPPAGETLPGDPSPDMLVVHQQDVQAVVNALWAGGARAMTIMGKRVVATTAVRCVGNTLLLQGQVYSPPFTVTAVGNPARLTKALNDSPTVAIYRQYVDAYGLGYTVSEHAKVTLPGYQGSLRLHYAKAAG